MSTARPHVAYPAAPGARGDELFYDAFDAAEGAVAPGLFPRMLNTGGPLNKIQ